MQEVCSTNPKPFLAAGVTLQPQRLYPMYQAVFMRASEKEEILSQFWELGAPFPALGDGGKSHCLLRTWHGALVRLSCTARGETAGQQEV